MGQPSKVRILTILSTYYPSLPMTSVATTPFKTLIATLISQRARDDQMIPVARELFLLADTPKKILRLNQRTLEDVLQPAGKHLQNAQRIKRISRILISEFNGHVPSDEQNLLSLPGIGRKTANIVLSHAFGKDAIAVDTHVHRITNRLGWIRTTTPEQTELRLKRAIPQDLWSIVNRVFVRHGQTICTPLSPKCSSCPIRTNCRKIGVNRSR